MLPWRQIPVRLVRQPGPDLSFADVRARLLSILHGESEIADFLKLPAGEAMARLNQARTPGELIAMEVRDERRRAIRTRSVSRHRPCHLELKFLYVIGAFMLHRKGGVGRNA